MENETLYTEKLYCLVCGSDDVEETRWIKVNDTSVIGDLTADDGTYCNDCEELTAIGHIEDVGMYLEEEQL